MCNRRWTVLEELRISYEDPSFFDDGAMTYTWDCYFSAAEFHGLPVEPDYVDDIYSYAIEAAEALGI